MECNLCEKELEIEEIVHDYMYNEYCEECMKVLEERVWHSE